VRSGDVFFRVETIRHPRFEREGDNLKTKVKLSLKEALLGFKKEVSHLDGHPVEIEKTKVTQPGEVEKMIDEGMPKYQYGSEHGDLFITYDVELPKKLSEE